MAARLVFALCGMGLLVGFFMPWLTIGELVSVSGLGLAFVEALKSAGYFTADAGPYARAVTSLWKEYLPMVETLREPDTEPAPPLSEEPDHEAARQSLNWAALDRFVNNEYERITSEPHEDG